MICCSTYLRIRWLILACALTSDQTHNLGISGQYSNLLSYLARAIYVILTNADYAVLWTYDSLLFSPCWPTTDYFVLYIITNIPLSICSILDPTLTFSRNLLHRSLCDNINSWYKPCFCSPK